ncbi:MAG: glycosyltransferase family 2 protein [Burkholderiaceae bacterium]|jgi:glycosyltransferase involved in cell wall biosynthesis
MGIGSRTHVVLIPSYNTGPKVLDTVRAALRYWEPVWVVVDGSTDGSATLLEALAREVGGLTVLVLPQNRGKGAAVLHGLRKAHAAGFSHVLTMDSDGQHPAESIREFMERSSIEPDALILGLPVFDSSAPAIRVRGHKLSNWLANLESVGAGIGDSLFGMRVYPIPVLRRTMESTRWMRRFDFDPEAAVRLTWLGLKPVNLATPVRYFTKAEGGVSHFSYLRDNLLLSFMHLRLFGGCLIRLPRLLRRRASTSRR